MRGPSDVRLVEDVGPFRVVFLLFALGCYMVHEVLRGRELACTYTMRALCELTRTQVARNVLNLNCLSRPLLSAQIFHRLLSTKVLVAPNTFCRSSPGEVVMLLRSMLLKSRLVCPGRIRRLSVLETVVASDPKRLEIILQKSCRLTRWYFSSDFDYSGLADKPLPYWRCTTRGLIYMAAPLIRYSRRVSRNRYRRHIRNSSWMKQRGRTSRGN